MSRIHQSSWYDSFQEHSFSNQSQSSTFKFQDDQLPETLSGTPEELEEYRTLYENLPVICLILNLEGVILRINQFGAQCLGYSPAELLACSIDKIVAPQNRPTLQEHLKKCWENPHNFFSLNLEFVDKNNQFLLIKGLVKLASWVTSAVDKTDKNSTILLVGEEIETGQYNSETIYRILAHNFPNGVVVLFDRECRYIFADGQELVRNNVAKEHIVGKTIREVYSPEFCAILEPRYRAALAGTADLFEVQYGDDTYLVNTLPLKNGRGEIWAGMSTSQNITERKRAEEALQQQAERERLIGAIAQRIRQSLNLEEILNTTVAEVRQFLQADRVLIYRVWQDGTGSAVTESVVPGWPAILQQTFSQEAFPPESQRLYSQGRTLAIDDIERAEVSPCMVEFVRQFGVKAKLVVPILQGEQRSQALGSCSSLELWGLLIVHHCSEPHQWQPFEIDLLKQLATQVGIAIQQSQLYEQVQRLNANLEQQVQERTAQLQQSLNFTAALQRITDKVRDSLDERQILQTAVQELTDILQATYCHAALYNAERTKATIRYEYSSSNIGSALGQVVSIEDAPQIYPKLLHGESEQACELDNPIYPRLTVPLMARLLAPIFDDQEAIGYLAVFHHTCYVFNDMEMRLVQQVANQCAIAIRQARLYQAAQAQVEELAKLNRLKDDFLSTVSHELRTPVANIKMALHMLALTIDRERPFFAEMAKPEAERSKLMRYFQILMSECERENSLINDLLELQQLDAGTQPLELEAIDLKNWIPHVVETFEEKARNQQQRIAIDIATNLPPLISDLFCLGHILTELLNNACKYTPPQETITVKALEQSGKLQLSVSNSGIEIPSSELERIFDKFYRIPQSDPWKHGGTGLGLALVEKLAKYLGGSVRVESHSNQTCFTVELPLEPRSSMVSG